jgi:hypothetical protein
MRFAASALLVALLAGCGGSNGESAGSEADEYPLVTQPLPKYAPPVTTPEGAIIHRPLPPTVKQVAPSASCERMMATFHDGSKPTRRPIIVPPAPGLRAAAVSTRTVRLAWSFATLPDDCRPEFVLLSVVAQADLKATPTNKDVPVNGKSGVAEITYPDFLDPPDVAHASAVTREGVRSRTVTVLIRR